MINGLRTTQPLDHVNMLFKKITFLNSSETFHYFRSIYSVDTSILYLMRRLQFCCEREGVAYIWHPLYLFSAT